MDTRIDSPPATSEPDKTVSLDKPQPGPAKVHTSIFIYLLAFAMGLFSGWVNEKVDDALLTALCVLFFTMLMGVWKKEQPWRWLLLVWSGVPLMLAYYHFVVGWPHDRGQVYGAFLQALSGSAGAFGGHFMRQVINRVFLNQED